MGVSLGNRQLLWLGCLVLAVVALVVTLLYQGAGTMRNLQGVLGAASSTCPQCEKKREMLKQSRIALSRDMNAVKQQLGQLSCKLRTFEKKSGVSENGGWCLKESKPDSPSHRFDTKLCDALARFLRGKRVASFGDGPGAYKQRMDQLGLVRKYDAFDGAPFVEQATSHRVRFLDLTAPQFGLELYDWVVSLEVAEHIPPQFEAVYVDNVVRHAREGLVLSWSRPNQGGLSHVNNKAPEDVIRLMSSKGFEVDQEAGKRLRSEATLPWLRNNVNVYRRRADSPVDLEEL